MTQITARLPDELVESLDATARELRKSRAEVVRAAIELYLAEYEDLNTWLLLRAEYSDGFAEEIELIPTLRFFYNNYFWEVGMDTNGRMRAMFMVHF